jgi:hypothetical protein
MSAPKQQTAVGWLFEKLRTETHTITEWEEIAKQCEAMFEQQIMDAWDNAAIDSTYGNKFSSPEQYYKETFKSEYYETDRS